MKLQTAILSTVLLLTTPALANTRVQKSFDGWQVDCVETDKAKNCSMSAALVNSKTKQVVISLSVAKTKDGNKLVVRTPNGVLLSAGVGLGFGNAKPSSLPFYTCGPKACIAETPLTDDWISALSADAELKITFSMVNAKPVSQGIPLKGFADGFKYFSEQVVAAQ
jgi:invasion protein IalB